MFSSLAHKALALLLFPVVWLAVPLLLDGVLLEANLTRYVFAPESLSRVDQNRAGLAWADYLVPLFIGSLASYTLAFAVHALWRRLGWLPSPGLTAHRLAKISALAAILAWPAILLGFAAYWLVWRTNGSFADQYLIYLLPFTPFISSVLILVAFGRRPRHNLLPT